MEDIHKRKNSTNIQTADKKQSVENSQKFINSKNSTRELLKLSSSNFLQHSTSDFPRPKYKINVSSEEDNTFISDNFLSYYTTSQRLSKVPTRYSKKNYPPKKEVCKGKINSNQKIKIPSSSAIIQYFNLDNIIKSDFTYQLDNKNIGKPSLGSKNNISRNYKYNYSSSDLFNKKLDFNLGIKKFIPIKKNDEYRQTIDKKYESGSLKINFGGVNKNNNSFDDENNYLLTKLKDIKKKKFMNKSKSNNNIKKSKSFQKNIKDICIICYKSKNKTYTKEIKDKQNKDSMNIHNILEEKNIGGAKNNNNLILEKNNSHLIPNNLSKNAYANLEKNNKLVILNNKEKIKEDINTDNVMQNNIITNNEKNNMNYNYKFSNNNFNNYIYINNNIKYINNMKITCNNINIYNNLNADKIFKFMNINYPNQIKFYYFNISNKEKNNFENIGYNYYNNIYKDLNKDNNFQKFNQTKGIHYQSNTYFPINDKIPNNSYINNFNNYSISKDNNNQQKKNESLIRLDDSFYIDRPLIFLSKNFYKLSKDQNACRYLQNILDANPQEALVYFYKPFCEHIVPLINYPFGNYVIQKIIMHLNQEQLYEILNIISKNFLEICNNIYGTRVIQTIIDYLKAPKVINFFYQLLKPKIIDLLKEVNGTFVVQKFSKVFNKYKNEINDIIINFSHILSTYRHGSCVLQNYLNLNDSYFVPKLIDKLIENCLILIVDQFANYVIQAIYKKNNIKYGNKIAEKIVENIVYYSKHKYSSNVVQKCFDYCDGIFLSNLIKSVQKKENLIELIFDEYGNFVVQKVLNLSSPKMQRQMLKVIKANIIKLKNCNHGKGLINRLLLDYPIINDKNFMNEI